MGLMDLIKGEFIDVIEWTDDSRDTLSYRFPDEDKAIKNGAQLIVRESQVAQFLYLGQFGDTFQPGKHTLTTDNIPILTKLKSWSYGFNSPFKADVFFIVTRLFTGNKWGTANPIMARDADFGVVRLRAFGTFDFKIINPQLFLKEVAGSDQHFRLDEFADTMRSRMVSVFSEALASAHVPVIDVATRYSELGEALLPVINPVVGAKYGLEITSFIVENVSVPRGSGSGHRQAIEHDGDRQPERLREVPDGSGHGHRIGRRGRHGGRARGGIRHRAADDAAGRAQSRRRRRRRARCAAAAAPAAGAAAPDLLAPADVAKRLGVPESDVMAIIESGELKAKKIGASYRITKAALDAYLAQ